MIFFDSSENVYFPGANLDEKRQKELEFKKKTEKNIWMTVPYNKLYIRNPASLISDYELKAIKNKQDAIEQGVKADKEKK